MEAIKDWLNPQHLFEELGISKSTQAKYRMDRKIPYHRVGKFIRYHRDEINEWMHAHRVDVDV